MGSEEALKAGRRRVLVVDDNPVNRELAVRMLAQLGWAADAAIDGAEALRAHRDHRYDLILMDCEMPHLDGYEATRRLRADEGVQAAKRTPVLALTAHAGPEQDARCRAAGMDEVLAKPLRPQVLGEVLSRWLAGPAPVPETSAPDPSDELEAVRDMFGPDFNTLASLYLQDGPPRLVGLSDARARSDLAMLAKLAHALSGSSASIGASGLASLCRELELCARADRQEEFAARMAAVENEYGRVAGRLRTLLAA